MATKTYRLKVRRIPLVNDIEYRRPNFPPFKELHLDLLENKLKLKKNPPKPIFVHEEPRRERQRDDDRNDDRDRDRDRDDDEDFTLEELERAYRDNDSDAEPVFPDDRDDDRDRNDGRRSPSPSPKREYRQQEFDQQQEEEEDEEERERKAKLELLHKFDVLKRKYHNVTIPEFTEHSDMTTMRNAYDKILRHVHLDDSVESYRRYLLGGFLVLEFVSTNWLGIDLSGFSQTQGAQMNSYERLLIELGEKNYSTAGSRFPVEVRLIFLIIFNAGFFYVQKMMMGGGGGMGGGANLLNMFFGGMGQQQPQPPQPQQPQQPPQPARRRGGMRGPTISTQEVEELTRQQTPGFDDEDDSN